jgi:hypothetical protein
MDSASSKICLYKCTLKSQGRHFFLIFWRQKLSIVILSKTIHPNCFFFPERLKTMGRLWGLMQAKWGHYIPWCGCPWAQLQSEGGQWHRQKTTAKMMMKSQTIQNTTTHYLYLSWKFFDRHSNEMSVSS